MGFSAIGRAMVRLETKVAERMRPPLALPRAVVASTAMDHQPFRGFDGYPTNAPMTVDGEAEARRSIEDWFPYSSSSPSGWSMQLMAVPKKKVSPYKRGLRNGPKALKPVPVIVRCKSCGRVKLPHFFCCSGDRGTSGRTDESAQ
ncbi:uncharacterized protein LOC116254658 [Nymphaea colorata]|nr:uncharacterized protein LOC116254658 [Nymphaea colorata]